MLNNEFNIRKQSVKYKTLPGNDFYEIGTDGSVWSYRKPGGQKNIRTEIPKQLKPFISKKMSDKYGSGYARIQLTYTDGTTITALVHRLVLETFISPCPEGMEACHENRDRSDNRLDNLRWDTRSSNIIDSVKQGTHHEHKLTANDIPKIFDMWNSGKPYKEIMDIYTISKCFLHRILFKKVWKFASEGLEKLSQSERKQKVKSNAF